MKKISILSLLIFCFLFITAQPLTPSQIAAWQKQAQQVTIIRDNYGIPHIYGKTDADAVFGLMYAQCEDDFKRVEMNYIEKLGRLAEVNGEEDLYNDLLIKMIIDTADAIKDYNNAPPWLKKLCNAFADGINYYLYKTNTKTALIKHFKPWFPMLWTDGSIGAISTADVTVNELKNFYSGEPPIAILEKDKTDENLTGSNGFAFSPKITESKNAILYINPHVTFYFRPEVHMVSNEGLNAYGAVTWGQFFVYQGFNQNCGWMHTSSKVDAADTYIEKITKQKNKLEYEYNNLYKPVVEKKIVLTYKLANEELTTKTIKALYTHHGPIMAKRNEQVLSIRADNRILNGLIQCWQRTKSKGLSDFKKTLDLKGNISNNTVYADDKGNIAYWHGNRIPKRNKNFNWSKPVDGSLFATEWTGYHKIDETVHIINPQNGWVQNCNATPFTVSGSFSPKKEPYPAYMAPDEENFRGLNAVRVLAEESNYNLEKVILAGYDTRLTAFEILIPPMIKAFESTTDTGIINLKEAIDILKAWDFKSAENSIATTLAIEWGQKILPVINRTVVENNVNAGTIEKTYEFIKTAAPKQYLQLLKITLFELQVRFGKWQMPWGEINRFQRISTDINNKFDDASESIPVPFVSSAWGMLPSYTSKTFPNTKKRYGVNGNSFVCAVEFGKKIKAKSLLAGGQSGNQNSPHFFDQAEMYSKGKFKDVLFYKEDVLKNSKKTYHPGE